MFSAVDSIEPFDQIAAKYCNVCPQKNFSINFVSMFWHCGTKVCCIKCNLWLGPLFICFLNVFLSCCQTFILYLWNFSQEQNVLRDLLKQCKAFWQKLSLTNYFSKLQLIVKVPKVQPCVAVYVCIYSY